MAFTGKATYSAGPNLPELAEDVADIVSLVSPYETPLLDHLGDAQRAATSTIHEWLEDTLLPNTDRVDDEPSNPATDTNLVVQHVDRFRVGDQVQPANSEEVLFVTAIDTQASTISVVRNYGQTPSSNIADEQTLHILGNAALEGDDAPAARFTNRQRVRNVTQIFTASVEVSGSQLAAKQIAIADELDYQKQERLRELLRDLENCIINGVSPTSNAQGNASTRRTMQGIIPFLGTNRFVSGSDGFPAGDEDDRLSETQLNTALRHIWEQSSGQIDTIVVNGFQKRRINSFMTAVRSYDARNTRYRDLVSSYESDFGVCRVVLCRWLPPDAVLLLDSSRVNVLPMTGRSFHFKKLGATGDREAGQIIGEYTLELRNENAHGIIRGLDVA